MGIVDASGNLSVIYPQTKASLVSCTSAKYGGSSNVTNVQSALNSLSTALGKYLPLSGGTMTGTIVTPANSKYGIEPSENNYGYIGTKTRCFYESYVNTVHAANVSIHKSGKYAYLGTNTLSDNRTINMPDKDGTVALTSDVDTRVPLSGGTMTGTLINSAANAYICSYSNQHYMLRNDGNAWYFMSSATVGGWDKGYVAFDTSMNLNMCYHSIINQSDRRSKKDITLVDDDKLMNFYSQLKPSRFKFIDNKDDKYKYGFIAQDVEEAMNNSGISVKDKALIQLPEEDHSMGEPRYSLSYNEFIPLNTRMIQILTDRINRQDEEIKLLKSEIELLKSKI
jgi:hypothetical protein